MKKLILLVCLCSLLGSCKEDKVKAQIETYLKAEIKDPSGYRLISMSSPEKIKLYFECTPEGKRIYDSLEAIARQKRQGIASPDFSQIAASLPKNHTKQEFMDACAKEESKMNDQCASINKPYMDYYKNEADKYEKLNNAFYIIKTLYQAGTALQQSKSFVLNNDMILVGTYGDSCQQQAKQYREENKKAHPAM